VRVVDLELEFWHFESRESGGNDYLEVASYEVPTSRNKNMNCQIMGGLGPLIRGEEVEISDFGKEREKCRIANS
jgi:hypothetical protein